MKIVDTRRITGPSLFTDVSGAMLDIDIPNFRHDDFLQVWGQTVQYVLNGVGWSKELTKTRCYNDGISLFISAPIDALYAACAVNEIVFDLTLSVLNGGELFLNPDKYAELKKEIADELNPDLIELNNAAESRNVRFLQSDDIVSVGTGTGSHQFSVDTIPTSDSIDWENVHDVRVVLITGTNGKSTTVRLLESMMTQAGIKTGASSTDGIRVNMVTVEAGDYSGPEGARATLRNNEVETAILEVARGGMLRRGLPVMNAQAAIITNVAEDHFGDYGVNSLDDMVATKFVIDQGLAEDGILVLNADDIKIVKYAQYITHEICWFSLDSSNQTVVEHIKKGNRACILEDDKIVYYRNGKKFILIDYHQIPLTMNGAAVYNISNSLGAVALAKSLDIEDEHIINSLSEFGNSNDDNPGRANIYNKNGMTILLDFAHNPHGMDALAKLVNNISANRKILLIGQVGDRSNEDIDNLVNSAAKINPDKVIISEIVNYLRGREVGEIPALITQSFKNNDISEDAMIYSDDMLAGVKKSLEIAEEGDLLVLLCLDQKKEILQFIKNEID